MGSNKGFASLSKQQRKLMSSKAGRLSQSKGVGYKLNKITAKAASDKGVQARRRKQARAAALILLEAGFSAEQLHELNLSEEELIYYGGSKRTGNRLKELIGRWESEHNTDRADPGVGAGVQTTDPEMP